MENRTEELDPNEHIAAAESIVREHQKKQQSHQDTTPHTAELESLTDHDKDKAVTEAKNIFAAADYHQQLKIQEHNAPTTYQQDVGKWDAIREAAKIIREAPSINLAKDDYKYLAIRIKKLDKLKNQLSKENADKAEWNQIVGQTTRPDKHNPDKKYQLIIGKNKEGEIYYHAEIINLLNGGEEQLYGASHLTQLGDNENNYISAYTILDKVENNQTLYIATTDRPKECAQIFSQVYDAIHPTPVRKVFNRLTQRLR